MHKEFNSSSLDYMDFNPGTNILEIGFKRGAIYKYFDVPSSVALELMQEESAGKFFSKNVAKVFQYEEIKFYG